MDFVLGVDGGNTKTIALVAQADGRIIGAGRSGCGDIYGIGGAEGAFESMRAAVSGALAAASISHEHIAAAAFSLAGADWPEDFDFLSEELARRGIAREALVVNDAIGALRAGSREGTGVSLVVGTGTAVGGRGAQGHVWHISFWLWEAHGAGELSRQVLRTLTRASLGLDPPTSLAPRLCEAFGVASVADLLHRITRRGGDLNMRQLAPALLSACECGDPAAQQLVRDFGATLGDYALAAARQVDLLQADYDLVLAGGVLRSNSHCLIDAIVHRVRAVSPGARPVRARFEPVVGALLLALESTGIGVGEPLLAVLEPTLPPPSLYSTE